MYRLTESELRESTGAKLGLPCRWEPVETTPPGRGSPVGTGRHKRSHIDRDLIGFADADEILHKGSRHSMSGSLVMRPISVALARQPVRYDHDIPIPCRMAAASFEMLD